MFFQFFVGVGERLIRGKASGKRPEELVDKFPQMPPDVQWHFIGHLQSSLEGTPRAMKSEAAVVMSADQTMLPLRFLARQSLNRLLAVLSGEFWRCSQYIKQADA